MPFNRREFIGSSISAASLAAAPFSAFGAAHGKLSIWFLGGTGFLGPHTVRYAMELGHVRTSVPVTARGFEPRQGGIGAGVVA